MIPEDWNEVNLLQICAEPPSYGANASAEPYQHGMPRYIRITDISDDGNLIEENRVSLNPISAENYLLQHGDIVIARTGATVGKSYIHQSQELACFAGYLIKFKLNTDLVNPKYMFHVLQSSLFRVFVESESRGAAQPNISSKQFGQFTFPLPPLSIQNLIVNVLDCALASIDNTRAMVRKLEMMKEGLQNDLLTGTHIISDEMLTQMEDIV